MFKFLNNLTQCKHTIEIKEGWIVVGRFRCMGPPNHEGVHQTLDHQKRVVQWHTNTAAQRHVEEHYGKTR